jgi:hypothetical protein
VEAAAIFCDINGRTGAYALWACQLDHADHGPACPKRYFRSGGVGPGVAEDGTAAAISHGSPRSFAEAQVRRGASNSRLPGTMIPL